MPEINNAKRCIVTPLLPFQPSEIGKILLVCALAKFLSDRKDDKNQLLTIVLALVIGLVPSFLVFGQPDLGTAIIYLMVIVLRRNPFLRNYSMD